MRIQKYLSEQGVCSRREAEELIKRGLISVNGKVVREMGVQINPAVDEVAVLPVGKKEMAMKQTVAFYKPRGISSSRIKSEGQNIYDLLPQFERLDVIGRLDKASEGLLLLSDDGVVAKAVTGEAHATEKEYEVTVREEVNAGRLKKLEPGIVLEDGPTLPCATKLVGPHRFRIIIREGRKHQIRRMCEFLHLTVVQLRRLRIGSITLGDLKPGVFRALSEREVALLKK